MFVKEFVLVQETIHLTHDSPYSVVPLVHELLVLCIQLLCLSLDPPVKICLVHVVLGNILEDFLYITLALIEHFSSIDHNEGRLPGDLWVLSEQLLVVNSC